MDKAKWWFEMCHSNLSYSLSDILILYVNHQHASYQLCLTEEEISIYNSTALHYVILHNVLVSLIRNTKCGTAQSA